MAEIRRIPPATKNASASTGNGPLDGMRILSFDHVLAGPYGTTILAELGADVIKVESSKGGMDPFRFFGAGGDPNVSARFLEFNRNKRSFTVNLKHPNGQKVLHDLVAKVDVVLDNFSVDVVGRIGLAYDQLCKVKADIVNSTYAWPRHHRPKASFLDPWGEYRFIHRAHSYVESSGQHQPARRLADGTAGLCFRRFCLRSSLFPVCSIAIVRGRAPLSTWHSPKPRRL